MFASLHFSQQTPNRGRIGLASAGPSPASGGINVEQVSHRCNCGNLVCSRDLKAAQENRSRSRVEGLLLSIELVQEVFDEPTGKLVLLFTRASIGPARILGALRKHRLSSILRWPGCNPLLYSAYLVLIASSFCIVFSGKHLSA